MKTDPVYAAAYKQRTAKANAKRRAENKETPEQRAKRLQRNREYTAKKHRERMRLKRLEELVNTVEKKPDPPKQPAFEKKKRGRILALIGWRGY